MKTSTANKMTVNDRNLLDLSTSFKNEFEPLRQSAHEADAILSELIECANQRREFSISKGDFLYYRIGEIRDSLRTALTLTTSSCNDEQF